MGQNRTEQRESILSPEQSPASGFTLGQLVDHLEVRGYEVTLLSGQRFASAKWCACVRASRRGHCSQLGHGNGDTALEALQQAYAKALEPEPEPKPRSRPQFQPNLALEDLDL